MSLKNVTDLLPFEVAQACLAKAYPLAMRNGLPPPGEAFFDPVYGPYTDARGVAEMLVQQFDVELCKALGLEFSADHDLSPMEDAA